MAFLDSALPGALSSTDEDFARMFLVHYTEAAFGRNRGEAKSLLRKLRSTAPSRFHSGDRALIFLLSELSDPAFSAEMDSLSEACRESGDFHPDISLAIADYYGKTGDGAGRETFLRHIADRTGYEARSVRDACLNLGAELLRKGKTEEGRKYLWMAVRYAQIKGEDLESQERIVRSLRQ